MSHCVCASVRMSMCSVIEYGMFVWHSPVFTNTHICVKFYMFYVFFLHIQYIIINIPFTIHKFIYVVCRFLAVTFLMGWWAVNEATAAMLQYCLPYFLYLHLFWHFFFGVIDVTTSNLLEFMLYRSVDNISMILFYPSFHLWFNYD